MAGLGTTSTTATRASKRPLALGWKDGQGSAPGTSARRALRNWQPLQTPRAKVSGRAKKAAKAAVGGGGDEEEAREEMDVEEDEEEGGGGRKREEEDDDWEG